MTTFNPCHLAETLRDDFLAVDAMVTDVAARLGCNRMALSQPLNGKLGTSPAMALELEHMGWSNAGYQMGRHAACDWRRSGAGRPPDTYNS